MKHSLVIISGILLVVPQVYTYAGDMEDMNHGQSGGQYMQNGQDHNWMKEEEKMRYQQGQQQPNWKMIQPTGWSKMLPPFGNQWSGPQGNMGNGSNPQWTWSGADAKMAQELKNRKRIVEELAKLWVDISVFTEEVINDPQAFWKLAESYRNIKQQSNSGKNMPNPDMKKSSENKPNGQWTWSGADAKMAYELANRKRIVEELKTLWADVSGFTDAVINDPQAFWKLAETFRTLKQQSNSGKNMPNPQMKDKERSDDTSREKMNEWMNSTSEKKVTPVRPALTEKARKLLQAKLDKIPTEKRDTLLPKMLKSAQAQLEAAQKKGNKVNIRKLEAIVEIIQDEIESEDDESLIDSLFTE
jgi:DNA-binding ferritin-like protein (Dps family)